MILNLTSTSKTIDVPFINFDESKQYFIEVISLGAHFSPTTKNTFLHITCNAIEVCYGLPYSIKIDGVCKNRTCHNFLSQRSDLRFRINTYNWRNTKFVIHLSDPKITIENFWIQIRITRE
jgi:hypothetical protein